MQQYKTAKYGSLRQGWAFLLLAIAVAVALRGWQLGAWPPGLYRDEAWNGLDALQVQSGTHALFFPANNGREPLYIYLTAVSLAFFGRSALAVRLAAAVAGSLTTLVTYKLAESWFGQRVGLLSAVLWAVTLWPVHLSRVGLRPILLPPLLGLTFWLGTVAYRRRRPGPWLAAGLCYGLAFYTYLAVRFTPLLLAAFFLYLVITGRFSLPFAGWAAAARRRRVPPSAFFLLGTAVALLPFTLLILQQPDILLGRTGQVSILNPAVNGGDLWGTLLRQTGAALGMFGWRGDTILRHNPAGRPVFDWLMILPFLLGFARCLRRWRQPAQALLLLWVGVMLGPTILAEDTPHFLRAVGVLPALVILPALGLDLVWRQLARRSARLAAVCVGLLLLGSTLLTVRDYAAYSAQTETAYLFEDAAQTLAQQVNGETAETAVFIDERFWSGWPSIPFLVTHDNAQRFRPDAGLPGVARPFSVYAWPYGPLDFLPEAVRSPALVTVESGAAARGDLEPEPYALYTRYKVVRVADPPVRANFADQVQLRGATAVLPDAQTLVVTLTWGTETAVAQPLTAFVHVSGPDGLIGQLDGPPGAGFWPVGWWQPGVLVRERRIVPLAESFDPDRHQVTIGLYDQTQTRLPLLDGSKQPVGDAWRLEIVR